MLPGGLRHLDKGELLSVVSCEVVVGSQAWHYRRSGKVQCTLQFPSGRASGFVQLHVRSRVSVGALSRCLLQAEAADRLVYGAFPLSLLQVFCLGGCANCQHSEHMCCIHTFEHGPLSLTHSRGQTAAHHSIFSDTLLVSVSTCFSC